MPQSSTIYAVARVRAVEKGLISRDRMNRIAESSLEDAMRLLIESGYGDLPDARPEDCEAMIANERDKAARLVAEITPDQDVTNLFLMRADIHNIKVLVKARMMDDGEEPVLMAGGVYGADKLSAAVRDHQYRDLPHAIKEAMDALERELAQRFDARRVSLALDKAYLLHAAEVLKKRECGFASAYFAAMADFDNVLAMLRLRAVKSGKDSLTEAYLPGGAISLSTLESAFDMPFETMAKTVSTGPAASAIAAGLEELQKAGHISAIERARDDYLLSLVKSGKYKLDSIEPIVGYLLARERESLCIRVIITAKRNGLSDTVIQERLRELYG